MKNKLMLVLDIASTVLLAILLGLQIAALLRGCNAVEDEENYITL